VHRAQYARQNHLYAARARNRISTRDLREQTCLVVPAAHDVLDHLLAVERVLVTHDTQRGEAPKDSIHAEVGGLVIEQVIFLLSQSLYVLDVLSYREL
jgi:hypothetical protein